MHIATTDKRVSPAICYTRSMHMRGNYSTYAVHMSVTSLLAGLVPRLLLTFKCVEVEEGKKKL